MLRWLWRLLVGGCDHNWVEVSRKYTNINYGSLSVEFVPDTYPYISHELFTDKCDKCKRVRVQRVNQIKGKVRRK